MLNKEFKVLRFSKILQGFPKMYKLQHTYWATLSVYNPQQTYSPWSTEMCWSILLTPKALHKKRTVYNTSSHIGKTALCQVFQALIQ